MHCNMALNMTKLADHGKIFKAQNAMFQIRYKACKFWNGNVNVRILENGQQIQKDFAIKTPRSAGKWATNLKRVPC